MPELRARLTVRGARIDVSFASEDERRKFFDAVARGDAKMREVVQVLAGERMSVWIRPSSVDFYADLR